MLTNNFDREIMNIKNELLNLKTEKMKRINNLSVIEYTGSVTFQLEEYQASQYQTRIQSTSTAYITVTPALERGYFCTARIDITSLDGRKLIWNETGYNTNGLPYIEYNLRIYDSTNPDDIAKIAQGQTPEVTYNIIITSTTPLEIEWDY